jgi:hypothetical protein
MQKICLKLKSSTISVADAITTLKQFRYKDNSVDLKLFNELIKDLNTKSKVIFDVDNFQGMLSLDCPPWQTLSAIIFSVTYQYLINCVQLDITLRYKNGDEFGIELWNSRIYQEIREKLSNIMDTEKDYHEHFILEMFSDEIFEKFKCHNIQLISEGCGVGGDS